MIPLSLKSYCKATNGQTIKMPHISIHFPGNDKIVMFVKPYALAATIQQNP